VGALILEDQTGLRQATGPNFLLDWRNWAEVIVNIALVFDVI
jgi:hypothetical protein